MGKGYWMFVKDKDQDGYINHFLFGEILKEMK